MTEDASSGRSLRSNDVSGRNPKAPIAEAVGGTAATRALRLLCNAKPLPPSSGHMADKAFFDDLSGQ